MPKFGSVRFFPKICEPRTGPWFRFSHFAEPRTGPLRTGSKWSGSGSELVRTSEPAIIFVKFQEKWPQTILLLESDRRMSTKNCKLSFTSCRDVAFAVGTFQQLKLAKSLWDEAGSALQDLCVFAWRRALRSQTIFSNPGNSWVRCCNTRCMFAPDINSWRKDKIEPCLHPTMRQCCQHLLNEQLDNRGRNIKYIDNYGFSKGILTHTYHTTIVPDLVSMCPFSSVKTVRKSAVCSSCFKSFRACKITEWVWAWKDEIMSAVNFRCIVDATAPLLRFVRNIAPGRY